jgi:hypothetical protein
MRVSLFFLVTMSSVDFLRQLGDRSPGVLLALLIGEFLPFCRLAPLLGYEVCHGVQLPVDVTQLLGLVVDVPVQLVYGHNVPIRRELAQQQPG